MFDDPQPDDIVVSVYGNVCTVKEFNAMSNMEKHTFCGLLEGKDNKFCTVKEYNAMTPLQKTAFAGGTIIDWTSMTIAILVGITIGTIIGNACMLGIKCIFLLIGGEI